MNARMIVTNNPCSFEKRRRRVVAFLVFVGLICAAESKSWAASGAQCSLGRAQAALDDAVPVEFRRHPDFKSYFEETGAVWEIDDAGITSQGHASPGHALDGARPCAHEILYRTRFEQALRMRMHQTQYDWDVLNAVDDLNTEFLKGWLEVSSAGAAAAPQAPADWRPDLQPAVLRLGLHARDVDVQERVLEIVGSEERLQGESSTRRDYARLVDRVAVNRGRPQRFGTQRWIDGECTRLFELEDPDTLAERRAAFGLSPLGRDGLCED